MPLLGILHNIIGKIQQVPNYQKVPYTGFFGIKVDFQGHFTYNVPMTNATHDCKDELKEAKVQVTNARVATLKHFESHDGPIDASDLIIHLQKELKIDRATIFRILNVFTKSGLIKKLEFGEGKSRYELLRGDDHHHLICENCGCIEDIPDTLIPEAEKKIGDKHQFLIKRHSLEFFGLCKNCQQ